MIVGPTLKSTVCQQWHREVERKWFTYKVAVGVLLRLVAPSIQKDLCALLLCTGNQIFDALLALGADNRAEIGSLFKSAVDIQCLGTLGDLRKPFLGLANHDHSAQGHAALASSAKSRSHDSVQGVVLVAVGKDSGMVLGSQIGLDTLAIGRTTSVDVLTSTVATDKADRLDGRFIDDEVNSLCGTVDDVDDTGGEASFLSQLRQDHGSARVALRRLKDQTITSDGSNGDAPKRNHCGEVCGERLASERRAVDPP